MSPSADDSVLHALDLDPGARSGYVRDACGTDGDLRAEVERLLQIHDEYPEPEARSVSGDPWSDGSPSATDAPTVASVAGYRVIRELGRGGMGRVFLAEDPELHRQVAIKMLPAELTRDARRVERFRREARILAGLQHPGIAVVHRFGIDEGHPFLVMEHVPGETLRDLLRTGPLDPARAEQIAGQVARALAAAHEAGVIHRDVTPANVLVRPDGSVTLLDFGLAKVDGPTEGDADTMLASSGLMGSPGYVSPEQVRGDPVDHRTDVWSFGCIVFECLAGRAAFEGVTPLDRLMSVLDDDPDWDSLPPAAATRWKPLLARCLARSPEERPGSFAEIVAGLDERHSHAGPTPGGGRPASPPERPRNLVGIAVLFLAVAVALFIWRTPTWRGGPAPPVTTHRQLSFDGRTTEAVLSPTGDVVAAIFDFRGLELIDATTGERRSAAAMAWIRSLAWSHDGERLLFVGSRYAGEGYPGTYVLDRSGGEPERVGGEGFDGHSFSPDGRRIAGLRRGASDVPRPCVLEIATGEATPLRVPGQRRGPPRLTWSPVADAIVVSERGPSPELWITTPDGTGSHRVEVEGTMDHVVWTPRGDGILYRSDADALMRIPVDAGTGRPRGDPVRILDRAPEAELSLGGEPPYRAAHVRSTWSSNLWWAERPAGGWEGDPRWIRLTQGTFRDVWCRLSPDGSRVAFRRIGRRADLFVVNLADRTETRLTDDDAGELGPAWSPDGTRIAFSDRDGIHVIDVASGRREEVRSVAGASHLTWAPAPNLFYRVPDIVDRNELELDLAGGDPVPLLADDRRGTFFQVARSPSGSRIAFSGNRPDGDDLRVWMLDCATGEERLLHDGWAAPFAWSPDGAYVYLITDDPAMRRQGRTAVLRVSEDGGDAERLFDLPGPLGGWSSISMSGDGSRLVCAVRDRRADVWILEGIMP